MQRLFLIQHDGLFSDDPYLIKILEQAHVRPGGLYIVDLLHVHRYEWLFRTIGGAMSLLHVVDQDGWNAPLPQLVEFELYFNPPQGPMNIYRAAIDCTNPDVVRIGACRYTSYVLH